MAGVSLKVPVQHLIDNAEEQRAEVIAEHAKNVKAYKEDRTDVREQLANALHAQFWAFSEENRKLPPTNRRWERGEYRNFITVAVSVPVVEKPADKADTKSIDADLRLLRATSQEQLTVRADAHLARYL